MTDRTKTLKPRTSYLVAVVGITKGLLAQCFAHTRVEASRVIEAAFIDAFGEECAAQCIATGAPYGYWVECSVERLVSEFSARGQEGSTVHMLQLTAAGRKNAIAASLADDLPASLPELMMHVLDRLADGEDFNAVVEATGITARVAETIEVMRKAAQEGSVNRLIQDLQALSLQGFGEHAAQVMMYAGGEDEPFNLVPVKPEYEGGPVTMQPISVRY